MTTRRRPILSASLCLGLTLASCQNGNPPGGSGQDGGGGGQDGGGGDMAMPSGGNPDLSMPSGPDLAMPGLTLISAMPARGPSDGGGAMPITVTLNGTLFQQGATVKFGSVPATNVMVTSSTVLTASLPAQLGVQGPVPVTITNPDNTTVTRSDVFGYYSSKSVSFNRAFVFTGSGPDYAADVDLDKKLDLVAYVSPNLITYFGLGDGTFGAAKTAALPRMAGTFTYSAGKLQDLNGDKKVDYLEFRNDGNLFVYPGNGDGTFAAPITSTASPNITNYYMSDVNNDGKVDILTAVDSNNYAVLLGDGKGKFQALPSARFINPLATGPIVEDFNNDGKPDLLYTSGAIYSVQPGKGDGTFGVAVNTTLSSYPTLFSLDLNNDGKRDVLSTQATFYNGASYNFYIDQYLGGGDGTFKLKSQNFTTNSNYYNPTVALTSVDFDWDGYPDLLYLVADSSLNWIRTLANGSFAANNYVGTTANYVVGDFNGDNKQDFAYQSSGVVIMLNSSQ